MAALLNSSSSIASSRSAESPAVENGGYDLVADLRRRLGVNQQQRDSLVSYHTYVLEVSSIGLLAGFCIMSMYYILRNTCCKRVLAWGRWALY